MFVIKASGEREEFNSDKLENTLKRAGASSKLAKLIVLKIKKISYDGISTKEILNAALKELEAQEHHHIAAKYNLKTAIMELGPAGYDFETYVGEILRRYDYETQLRQKILGKCVLQEIDVIAADRKTKDIAMIECKYHNQSGIYTGLKEAMYTYARFLDVSEGFKAKKNNIDFDQAWLVTNTKISDEALKYAKCKGMEVIAWKFGTKSLLKMITDKKLYPVTVLRTIDHFAKVKFASAELVIVEDILTYQPDELVQMTGLSVGVIKKAQLEIERIIKE